MSYTFPNAPIGIQMEKRLGQLDEQNKRYEDGVQVIDTEKGQLQVVLDSARNNADVRRPDGRKSPTMLACEEVFRLQKEVNFLRNYELARESMYLANLGDRERMVLELRAELIWAKTPWWVKAYNRVAWRFV